MADISQQLKEQVLQARDSGHKLNIVGGGTKAFMGREADADAGTLNVGEHTGIVDYHPVELVLTVRAGTPLSEIEATLAEEGQCLHFEPPHFGEASTIGGTLACNLSGPGRPWAGSVRDQVLGIRLLNGKGEHLRFGGQVMKNVAGYDVSRLQAGALGTLGVITEISMKVMPKPAASDPGSGDGHGRGDSLYEQPRRRAQADHGRLLGRRQGLPAPGRCQVGSGSYG